LQSAQQAYEWLQHQCFKTHFLNTEDIKQRIADAEAHPGKFQSNQYSRLHELYKGIPTQWLMGLNTLGLVAICPTGL
jgi:hypothetical protein|tara:strand:- start:6 stop:236 length:231 start_codon:yes stop_codon:yes gene_type:complete